MDNNNPNNPNQPQPASPSPNPWETPASPPLSQPVSTPLPEPHWPSSTNPGMDTQMSQPSLQQNQTDFSQQLPAGTVQPTQPPTDPGLFSNTSPTTPPEPSQPGISEPPVQNPGTSPFPGNPFQSVSSQTTQQDPLNTAFAPAPNPNETNPFSAPPAPGSIPETPIQPSQPQTIPQPQNPAAETTSLNPPQSAQNQQIPSSNQPGALDLSSLQANPAPAPEGTPTQSVTSTSLPEMGSVENAPTDLSHLIAGEETSQQPGDIYNPPVASDHNPGFNSTQPQVPSADGAPPQEKHLNLTKVLLVAGIPIILIVAALSAYIFLGVGKSSPKSTTNQTSLPAIQTKSEQAPLTNPPQQIVAPSPAVIPNPQVIASPNGPDSTSSSTILPGVTSSPTSALEQLKAKQSVAPSPGTQTSTSLP